MPVTYPGERLGLPATGPGSVPGWQSRVSAGLADGALFVAAVLTGLAAGWSSGRLAALMVAVTVVDQTVLPWLTGTTVGKWLFGLRIVPCLDGEVVLGQRGLTLLTAIGRTIYSTRRRYTTTLGSADEDGRTARDRACKTIVVRA